MNVSILLIILLAGAFITYFSSEKLARQTALFVSLVALVATGVLLSEFQSGSSVDLVAQWISKPNISFYLKADGLSLALVLLTTSLMPLVIYSSFGNSFQNKKTLYALILFMAFAMVGTFLAADGFLYYIFWELSLIPIYFIGLLWGNGDLAERQKDHDKVLYLHFCRLVVYVGCLYLSLPKSRKFLVRRPIRIRS